jgi:hypothetical protein
MEFLVSDCSVGKYGSQVGKYGSQVGKKGSQVGKFESNKKIKIII